MSFIIEVINVLNGAQVSPEWFLHSVEEFSDGSEANVVCKNNAKPTLLNTRTDSVTVTISPPAEAANADHNWFIKIQSNNDFSLEPGSSEIISSEQKEVDTYYYLKGFYANCKLIVKGPGEGSTQQQPTNVRIGDG